MLVGDITSYARVTLATPNVNQSRWTDQSLVLLVDRAQKSIMTRLLFPESRLVTTVAAGVTAQLFTFPDTLRIYRVYVNGQPYVPTPGNIDTLEGNQVQIFDQSGNGTPSLDAPQGGSGMYQPTWATLSPSTAPFLSSLGIQAPFASPSIIGQRPRYYKRSGALGLVPAVTGTATITVDCVLVPETVSSVTQTLLLPENCADALMWNVVTRAKFADDTDRSADQRNFALGQFEEEMKTLRTWWRQYSMESGVEVFPQNTRNSFEFGLNRAGNAGGDW